MARLVEVYNGYPPLQFSLPQLVDFFHYLDHWGKYSIPSGDLSIAFLDGESLRILHGEFLNDDAPTDVITFPGDPSERFAGEICVSVDYALEYSEAAGGAFADEISLYLIHGWLHLAGLDDRSPEDAQCMRRAESEALAFLGENSQLVAFQIE